MRCSARRPKASTHLDTHTGCVRDSHVGARVAEKPVNDYEIVKATEIMDKPLEMMREVNELLQVHPTVARYAVVTAMWMW